MADNDFSTFRWTEADCGRHFKLLPRSIVAVDGPDGVEPSLWAHLGRSAQAVLPVLLRHADETGRAWPSEGRIAAMSGLTRKSARAAALELETQGIITIRSCTSRQGRRAKSYRFIAPPDGKHGIVMPSIFIDAGLWSMLRPAAKSLALAFRLFASPRPDLDPSTEHTWLEGEDFSEYLAERSCDYCRAEPCVLRAIAGIGPRVYPDAVRDLVKRHFIEPDGARPDLWMVLMDTPKVMNPAYLNARLDGEGW